MPWYDTAADTGFQIHGFHVYEPMPAQMVHRPAGFADLQLGTNSDDLWLLVLFYDAVQIHLGGSCHNQAGPCLVIWPPNTPHHFGNPDNRWHHSWCIARGELIAELCSTCALPLQRCIGVNNLSECERFFRDCGRELDEYLEIDQHIIRNLFENFMRGLQRSRVSDGDNNRMFTIKRYIDGHLQNTLKLKLLADEAGLSTSHLSSEFKKCFKLSPMEYVIKRRLEEAMYLLGDHNLQIKEIAHRVGYNDEFHFSRLFKKRFGLSPRAMRQRHQ